MRALFIQQDHVSPVGPIGERFEQRGYDVVELPVVPEHRFLSPNVDVAFPDPTGYDVIVPMGAPWSVYDTDMIGAWVHAEVTMLRRAHEDGVPVLAICFGGQAIAAALGGSVAKAPQGEHGWMNLRSADESLIEPGPWFEYHSDRWETPVGAQEIAWTDHAVQAFTADRTLAVQFHPELTASMLQGWLDTGGREDFLAHGLDPDAVMAETKVLEVDAVDRAHRLVDRFLDQVATRP